MPLPAAQQFNQAGVDTIVDAINRDPALQAQVVGQLRRDPRGFLASIFQFTPLQQQTLQRLDQPRLDTLAQSLITAFESPLEAKIVLQAVAPLPPNARGLRAQSWERIGAAVDEIIEGGRKVVRGVVTIAKECVS